VNATDRAPHVLVTDDGPIRYLTLNRPDRLNALTLDSYRQLADAFRAATTGPDVRVVVLRGSGRAFCSGVDLDALPATDTHQLSAAFVDMLQALDAIPRPVIAAVHGAAVGLGMTIQLHCDLVVLAESARLRLPFTALGTAPEAGSSWLLARVIGRQRANDILLTSRWVAAAEAADIGLAARVCPDDDLADVVAGLAAELAQFEPAALAATKALGRVEWAPVALTVLHDEIAQSRAVQAASGRIGRGLRPG
jgi:enoyl-CoA hydratase/carnithine racemase